jgi:hypothetical protein
MAFEPRGHVTAPGNDVFVFAAGIFHRSLNETGGDASSFEFTGHSGVGENHVVPLQPIFGHGQSSFDGHLESTGFAVVMNWH